MGHLPKYKYVWVPDQILTEKEFSKSIKRDLL